MRHPTFLQKLAAGAALSGAALNPLASPSANAQDAASGPLPIAVVGVLPSTHDARQELSDALKASDIGKYHPAEMNAKDAAFVKSQVDALYNSLESAKLPSVVLPPKPDHYYSYDKFDAGLTYGIAQNLDPAKPAYCAEGNATAVTISNAMLEEYHLRPEKLRADLAGELTGLIITYNPELVAKLSPQMPQPGDSPDLAALRADLTSSIQADLSSKIPVSPPGYDTPENQAARAAVEKAYEENLAHALLTMTITSPEAFIASLTSPEFTDHTLNKMTEESAKYSGSNLPPEARREMRDYLSKQIDEINSSMQVTATNPGFPDPTILTQAFATLRAANAETAKAPASTVAAPGQMPHTDKVRASQQPELNGKVISI